MFDKGTGIGVDVVELARLERSLTRSPEAFAARVFTAAERERARASARPLEHFACLFAAKEALFKAIGLPYDAGFEWRDLDVDPGSARRRPRVRCTGAIGRHLGDDRLHLALGTTGKVAMAFAMRVRSETRGVRLEE